MGISAIFKGRSTGTFGRTVGPLCHLGPGPQDHRANSDTQCISSLTTTEAQRCHGDLTGNELSRSGVFKVRSHFETKAKLWVPYLSIVMRVSARLETMVIVVAMVDKEAAASHDFCEILEDMLWVHSLKKSLLLMLSKAKCGIPSCPNSTPLTSDQFLINIGTVIGR